MASALLLALTSGCDAYFSYERTGAALEDAAASPGADLATSASADMTGGDLARADLAPAGEQVIAVGTFAGRAGHGGAGTATVVRSAEGGYELRLGADFGVSGVPGPYLYLSSRADLGSSLDPAKDKEISALRMGSGAQSYALASGDVSGLYVWVWCRPFAVEVARAPLRAP